MDRVDIRFSKLVNYFLYFMLVYNLSHMIGLGMSLRSGFQQEFLLVLAAASAAAYVVLNPISLYFASTAMLFASLITDRYYKEWLIDLYPRITGLSNNIINNFLGRENITEANMIPYFLLIAFVIGIFTAVIIFKKKNIIILLPPHLSAYLLYWYNFNDQAYRQLALFIALYLILWSKRAFSAKKIDPETSSISQTHLLVPWISTAVRYSLVVVLLAMLLPKTNKHLTFPWLQDYVYKTFPAVEDMRSQEVSSRGFGPATSFNFSTTGFQSDNSRLGGPVIESNERVMTIKTSRALYMRGNIKHTYTGSSWVTDIEAPLIYKLLEDLSGISSGDKELFYDKVEATVTYRDFASTTVFSPFLTENINSLDTKNVLFFRDGVLAAPEGLYDGETYYISILVPKPYGVRLANGQFESIDDIKDIDLYLQLPDGVITERTIELTNNLTDDKDSPYEKATAIEDYLRKNYTYNLDVDHVLPESDFVDYFLFEGKEGYCTYYASSMAVMLRIAGIPSRYVEGFAARGPADDGVYEVTNKNAHSWVEAFIEPVGWMTFEPTPSLPLPLRLEGFSYEDTDSEIDIPTRGMGRDPDGHGEETKYPEGDSPENHIGIDTPVIFTLLLLFASLILLVLIPGRIFFGIIKTKRYERVIEAMGPNQKLIRKYDKIIQLLILLGYPPNAGETHYEYAKRVSYKFNDLRGTGILSITDVFVKSKYGMIIPNDEDVKNTGIFIDTLEEKVKKHLGYPKYYWIKYVKGFKN